MITVNELPLPEIEEVTKSTRPLGLGIMGYANGLYALDIPYNSDKAKHFTNELLQFIWKYAKNTSMELADEKGVYPAWEGSQWAKVDVPIRNCNLLSIAPNGSISFLAGTSGGLEPNFALVYDRYTNEGDKYICVNKVFEQELKEKGLYSEELLQKVKNNNGSVQGLNEIPEDMQEKYVIASDMTPIEHLDILEVFYKFIDLSASKTINFSEDATIEDIEDIYMDAWKRNIKCVTVYRNNSRENQTLRTDDGENNTNQEQPLIEPSQDLLQGVKIKLYSGCGQLYIHADYDSETKNIKEVFIETDGKGGCLSSLKAIGIQISHQLRSGIPLEEVASQLDMAYKCGSYMYSKGKGEKLSDGMNCPSAIGRSLLKIQKMLHDGEIDTNIIDLSETENEVKGVEGDDNKCPECGENLIHESGCVKCICGWSKCS